MLQSQSKINNQVIALVLFVFFNLTSCNCGNKNDQGSSSSKTSSDPNSGGTNPGTDTPTTGTPTTSTPTTGTPPSTGGTNTGNTSITSQKIDELLQELQDRENPATDKLKGDLISFLQEAKANNIHNGSKKLYLLSAIKYNNIKSKIKEYNTKDVLTLAIDKLTDIINTSFQGQTFLEHADIYKNTEARKLLVQKGAK